ncbi:MAG: nitroreductase family protein [Clostridium sp.]|nr:nitroreductase family protein [Clostridium sp.]MBS5885017.1 nitroreductase family protein [Clostridium sp.]MDU7148513.1 nitroreductase family protein [Clostridium sp.]
MPEDSNEVLKEEDYAANCALIQNFQLAAWERGLGVFWKGDAYLSSQEFREEIGVKKDEKVVAILHVGYPDIISKAHPRTPIAEKVTIIDNDNLK